MKVKFYDVNKPVEHGADFEVEVPFTVTKLADWMAASLGTDRETGERVLAVAFKEGHEEGS